MAAYLRGGDLPALVLGIAELCGRDALLRSLDLSAYGVPHQVRVRAGQGQALHAGLQCLCQRASSRLRGLAQGAERACWRRHRAAC